MAAHFDNPELFQNSLTSLFLMYEQKESGTNQWLREKRNSASYNVPDSVMTELETIIAELSRKMPEMAIINADNLWQNPDYETRKTAVNIISNLDDAYEKEILPRVQSWLSIDLDDALINDIFSAVEAKHGIIQNKQWLDMVKTWLESSEDKIIKLGLPGLKRTIPQNFQNLPGIFSMVTPVISNPRLGIQKEMINVIQALIDQSEAETASFFMMISDLYPSDEVKKFMRKCLPLFDNFFQKELRNALSK